MSKFPQQPPLPGIYESREKPRLKVLFSSGVKVSGVKLTYLAGELDKSLTEFSEMLTGANGRRYDIDQYQTTLDNLHEAGSDLPRRIAEWHRDRYLKTPEQTREEVMEEIRAIAKSVQAANDRLPDLVRTIEKATAKKK
ncbi:MAG: hypothetical protein M0Z38_02465 [Deltaproteobacteria bacterium]|nr:hypothetical protein [Deltaproteobacteria bacterium]